MSKYKTGDTFIIELAEPLSDTGDGGTLFRVKGFNSLCMDEYGLDKLTRPTPTEHSEWYDLGFVTGQREMINKILKYNMDLIKEVQ